MSDPATNNQSKSYVDSYTPPAGGVPTINTNPQQTTLVSNDDALKKLEELVSEFETKREDKKSEQMATIDNLKKKADEVSSIKTSPSGKPSKTVDPLAELERALDQYEKKYRDKVGAAKKDKPEFKVDVPKSSQETPMTEEKADGESIEEQNIFELLGVGDASETEKESFLDELQQALWEDFLDKDLALLVSDQQMAEIEKVKADVGLAEDKKQAALIKKIEEHVPDIEEIMMEKALELKEDMIFERVNGIRESFKQAGQDESRLDEAEKHLKKGHWKSGAQVLNSI